MRDNFNFNNDNCCSPSIPNGKKFYVHKNECEVHVDIEVDCVKGVVIWGYVYDCNKRLVKEVLVKLFKQNQNCELQFCAKTFTDCNGYYEFNLSSCNFGKYVVIVSECTNERYPKKNDCEQGYNESMCNNCYREKSCNSKTKYQHNCDCEDKKQSNIFYY